MSNLNARDSHLSSATPTKVVDETVNFVAFGGRHGRCRVRIYHASDGAVIVVYSALAGPPLPYACEELVAQLLQRYFAERAVDLSAITWLEHHPAARRSGLMAHVAARDVRFKELRWSSAGRPYTSAPVVHQPVWRDLLQADVLAIVGERLD